MPRNNKIAAVIITQKHGMHLVLKSIENLYNNVDEILIQSEDDLSEYKEILKKYNVNVYYEPWQDSFTNYKNTALRKIQSSHWVINLDHDEVPSLDICKDLRRLVKESKWASKYDAVVFRSRGVIDEIPTLGEPGYGKHLLHINIRDPFHGLCHNHMKPGIIRKEIYSDLIYEHHKTTDSLLRNSIRNIFLAGGGDNFENKSGIWKPLRDWCHRYHIDKYVQFLNYLDDGNVDPWLKEWMEKATSLIWHDNEYKAFEEYYYRIHSNEKHKH